MHSTPSRPPSRQETRREAIAHLVDPQTWASLNERMEVVIEPFGASEDSTGSDLHAALADAPEKLANLIGVVFISDGDWNEGEPPVEAATSLRLSDIPVLAIPHRQSHAAA